MTRRPRRKARALLERVGLGERLSHYPKTLSGGEQQRVALARAFAPNPPLLFADEPTGSLDSGTGERIIELLFALNREAGATLVLVTHDVALASRCDRRLTLKAGREWDAYELDCVERCRGRLRRRGTLAHAARPGQRAHPRDQVERRRIGVRGGFGVAGENVSVRVASCLPSSTPH